MSRTKRSKPETGPKGLSAHERWLQRVEQMAKRAMDPNTPLEERVDLTIKLARMIYKKPEPIYELVSFNGVPMDEPIEMTRSDYRKLFEKSLPANLDVQSDADTKGQRPSERHVNVASDFISLPDCRERLGGSSIPLTGGLIC